MESRRVTEYCKYMSESERREILTFSLLFSPSVRLAIHVLDKLGIRVGEAVGIKEEHIDFDNAILNVHATKQDKVIPRVIPDCLLRRFRVHIKQYGKFFNDGYMIYARGSNARGPHLSKNTIGAFFVRFRREYGYTKPYAYCRNGKPMYRHATHTFRSYWISRYTEANGGNIRDTQLEIGHKKAETTIRYWRFAERQQRVRDVVNEMFTA